MNVIYLPIITTIYKQGPKKKKNAYILFSSKLLKRNYVVNTSFYLFSIAKMCSYLLIFYILRKTHIEIFQNHTRKHSNKLLSGKYNMECMFIRLLICVCVCVCTFNIHNGNKEKCKIIL